MQKTSNNNQLHIDTHKLNGRVYICYVSFFTEIMIAENSGKIFRFKLEHSLGYGFAEVYDFTDQIMVDGRVVYVFNKLEEDEKAKHSFSELRGTGISLGPIRLYKFPATRGLHSWKYLFKTDEFLIEELPETKVLHGLEYKDNNWNNFTTWYKSSQDVRKPLVYFNYEEVRHLETRIINSPLGVVREFTMKVILDRNEKVSDYYDLSQIGNKNLFVYLVNTYYPLSKTLQFLKLLPQEGNQTAHNNCLPK